MKPCRVLVLHHGSVFSHKIFWGVLRLSCIMECLCIFMHFHSTWDLRHRPHTIHGIHCQTSLCSRRDCISNLIQNCMSHGTTCCSFTNLKSCRDLISQRGTPSQNLRSASFYLTKLTPHEISHRDRRACVFPKSHWSNQCAGTSATNSPISSASKEVYGVEKLTVWGGLGNFTLRFIPSKKGSLIEIVNLCFRVP